MSAEKRIAAALASIGEATNHIYEAARQIAEGLFLEDAEQLEEVALQLEAILADLYMPTTQSGRPE